MQRLTKIFSGVHRQEFTARVETFGTPRLALPNIICKYIFASHLDPIPFLNTGGGPDGAEIFCLCIGITIMFEKNNYVVGNLPFRFIVGPRI